MLATPVDRIDGYIAEMHRLRLIPLTEICNISAFSRLPLNHRDVCEQSQSSMSVLKKLE